jgi:hypothetical protein
MGSIGKYIFRTTLASLALISVSLAGALRIGRMIPAFATGESNAHLPRLLGRPVTA